MNNKYDKCDCNFSSDTGYIENDKISISEYFNNMDLYKNKNIVCENNVSLVPCNGEKVKPYFKHKSPSNNMCDWHKEWQSKFEQSEVRIGNCIADSVLNNYVIEFQHSEIKEEVVKNRNENYNENNYNLIWVIDGNKGIEIVNKYNDESVLIIKFNKDRWKYNSFSKTSDVIYLNKNDKIFKIYLKDIKCDMITVNEYKTRKEFINSLENGKLDLLWKNEKIDQCTLYYNQQGAGCGKTYNSIQALNNGFEHKTNFIYLTKMHSAKDVIYNELREQRDNGYLQNLEFDDETDVEYEKSGKQYKINFIKNNISCSVTIGTIDSFMYSVNKKNQQTKTTSGYFKEIIKNIIENKAEKVEDTRYVGTKLNKETLIIIDEAQDLEKEYVQAICLIMNATYVDTYVIGDRLQSIFMEDNVMTYLDGKNYEGNIKIIKNKEINQVRRFHHEQLKDKVNEVIDYGKYGLIPIENICPNICPSKCKYHHIHNEPTHNAWEKIFVPTIYANDYDNDKVHKTLDDIITRIDDNVDRYSYGPENFMFIFPILKNNLLAIKLLEYIQVYWIEKMNKLATSGSEYWNENKHKYWNEGKNKYNDFVQLHKSEENKPINLRESEHATQILSIHAAKGNGREIVFLLNLTERNLKMFSRESDLIYESLFHVAITRQKVKLYIGMNTNDLTDDIYNKLGGIDDKEGEFLVTKFIKYDKVIDLAIINCNKKIEPMIDYELKEENNPNNIKNIIQWEHHLIRFTVMKYRLLFNIINKEKIDLDHDHTLRVLRKIGRSKISICKSSKEYNQKLCEIYGNIKENTENKSNLCETDEIPILELSKNSVYRSYRKILHRYIEEIQSKINKEIKDKKLPNLCPLECVILHYMMKTQEGINNTNISIINVYSIINKYLESSGCSTIHSDYGCLCNEEIEQRISKEVKSDKKNIEKEKEKENIKEEIVQFYNNITHVDKIYESYSCYLKKNFPDETFNYNINTTIKLSGKDDFITMQKFDVIARSEKSVIFFNLKPQLTTLNFSEYMTKNIFNKYIISNPSHDKNVEKFKNKNVIACMIALNYNEPMFYSYEKSDNLIIKESIKDSLKNHFSQFSKSIFKIYDKTVRGHDSFLEKLEFFLQKVDIIKWPGHIKKFLTHYKSSYERILCDSYDDMSEENYTDADKNESEKKRIEDIFRNEQKFIKELNLFLIMCLKSFIIEKKNL